MDKTLPAFDSAIAENYIERCCACMLAVETFKKEPA